MLKLASDNLENSVDELQNKLFAQTASEKNIFKAREVYDILRRHHSALKKESDKLLDQKFLLQHKIFSPQRTTEMAKNIFVHGDFKKLRSDFRRLKKDEEKFSKNLQAFYTRENFAQKKLLDSCRATFSILTIKNACAIISLPNKTSQATLSIFNC